MDSSSDVRDILEASGYQQDAFRDSIYGPDSVRKMNFPKKLKKLDLKKPEGMHRELWGLLWTDNMDAPPLIPTETAQGYKVAKARLGSSKVRPWLWMPFQNPARKDGAVFHHWRRKADEGKDYPFAAFNKTVDVCVYTDLEFQQHLHTDSWTRQETDHLMELAGRFDLRFVIMHDRWNRDKFPDRSMESLKERYYNICNTLSRVRAPPGGPEPRIRMFDAEHEKKRKQQLINLYDRTEDQVDEEQTLINELRKIEMRKRERERKTQDLQKLISAADANTDTRRLEKKNIIHKKKLHHSNFKRDLTGVTPDTNGIKFPDSKQSGVSLRSHRLKLPPAVGQKKVKAIEQVLDELGLEFNPIPTEDIVNDFNELRQDIVLLYELNVALKNCEYELQTLKHRLQTLAPDRKVDLPVTFTDTTKDDSAERKISEAIDVIGSSTPNRKRKFPLDQSGMLKKIKDKKS